MRTPAKRADDDRRGQDHIAWHVQDLRHIEHDHAHDADDRADGEIDSADQNGKRLPHGEDGRERETRHEVLGVRGGGEAGGEHAKNGDGRREEKNERCRRGAERHGLRPLQRRAEAQSRPRHAARQEVTSAEKAEWSPHYFLVAMT